VGLVVTEAVTLEEVVLELVIDRDILGEDDDVFDIEADDVAVLETIDVLDIFADCVIEGDAEDVLDDANVLDWEALAVPVFELGADLLEHGLLEEVLELDMLPVVVLVGTVDRVIVVDPVIVFVCNVETVNKGEDDAVFDVNADLVSTILRTGVNVPIALFVISSDGLVVRVLVVVFVEVLDCIELIVGTTPNALPAFP
jgi:hypothetical protein